MMPNRLCTVLALLVALCVCSPSTANAYGLDYLERPIHSFPFIDGSLDDVDGQGYLRAERQGVAIGSEYVFGKNMGPTLVSPALSDSGEYTIEMSIVLRDPMTDGEGTIKMLDFKDLANNFGAYVIEGNLGYAVYDGSVPSTPSNSTTINAGVHSHVVVTRRRDTRMVTFYVDGTKVRSMSDVNQDFVIDGPLRFFQDDYDELCRVQGRGPRCDSGSGSIDYIKIYDSPLTSDDVALLYIQGEEMTSVTACQCNYKNGVCIEKPLNEHNMLDICIKCNREDFVVMRVDDLEYEQEGVVEVAIERGEERTRSTMVQKDGYVAISTLLPRTFFYTSKDVPSLITGKGSASIVPSVTSEDGGDRSQQPQQIKIFSDFEIVLADVERPDNYFFEPPEPDDSDPVKTDPPTPAPAPNNSTGGLLRIHVPEETSASKTPRIIVTMFLVMVFLVPSCAVVCCIKHFCFGCKRKPDKHNSR